ncbi:response regulator transcription factor [Cupriavidus sp. 2TAF22]|uniref:response regulator transcription factor n=1 Tax=unclassified Cupriavidus TaxID=2640874 RepID=UPI003F9384DD
MRRPCQTILVVDDEPGVADALACALEDAGYIVERAADGFSAYFMAQRVHPSVVVTDWIMPHGDGAVLCGMLLHDHALCATPLVISTSMRPVPTIANPSVRYCPKPCHPDEVVRLVRELAGESGESGACGPARP